MATEAMARLEQLQHDMDRYYEKNVESWRIFDLCSLRIADHCARMLNDEEYEILVAARQRMLDAWF